jgi:hypothetical protein
MMMASDVGYQDTIEVYVIRKRRGEAVLCAIQTFKMSGELLDDIEAPGNFIWQKVQHAREKCGQLWAKRRGGRLL